MDVFVTGRGEAMIAGPTDTFYDLSVDDEVLTGLRIRPGAAVAVIGCPANELANIRVPLDSILGVTASRIAESLITAKPPLFIADLSARPELDRPVIRAVEALRADPGRPVSVLAREVGLSERQLRRRFQTAVGYGPKRLGRVFRLQRLLDLAHASHGRLAWTQLAHAAGYADQSHMINECVALTGGPPTSLPMSVSSNTAAGSQS